MTLEIFESVMKVNLTGTFLCCRAVTPIMRKQGRGKIINIASLGGRTGRPGVGVNYAASKAGVIGLTQTLARELGPSGIYANAIARAHSHEQNSPVSAGDL
jgi:3-oxoacyl-[acyl-carrier protein] reductase